MRRRRMGEGLITQLLRLLQEWKEEEETFVSFHSLWMDAKDEG